jgi:hypothetical protein
MNNQQPASSAAVKEAQLDQMDPLKDNFFTPVSNTKPFLKAAFEGEAGSGKTLTAALLAIGTHQRIKSKKPVIMFDTESGAKYLKNPFKEAGIELLVRSSRTLADLIKTMEYCRNGKSDVLLIDSLTHVWDEFVASYLKKVNRDRLQMQDHMIIKPQWRKLFSEPLVNDKYHIIFCGRAADVYTTEVDEFGKKQSMVTGVKMAVEKQTAYEPDLLVLMERYEELKGKNNLVTYRQAKVVKDRSRLIDGKIFKDPTYKDFAPVVEDLLENPESPLADPITDSTGLFRTEEDKYQYINDKKICLEEIEGWMVKAWPSTGASDKQKKIDVLEKVFNTRSWLAVESKGLAELKSGLEKIKTMVDAELALQFPDKVDETPAAKAMKKGIEKSKRESKK